MELSKSFNEGIKYKLLKNQFNLKEAAEVINIELNLSGKDIISSTSLEYWRKIKLIDYLVIKGKAKITRLELNKIKKVVFYRVILGVELKKIPFTMEYFNKLKDLTKEL